MENIQISSTYDTTILDSFKKESVNYNVYIVTESTPEVLSIVHKIQKKFPLTTIKLTKFLDDVLFELITRRSKSNTFVLAKPEHIHQASIEFPGVKSYLSKNGVTFSSNITNLRYFLAKSQRIQK
ncbi:MAG: hypothetical protein ACW981_15350 [Candidatus Hodarchaeales archaeon]|jgi:hypothetical protein